MSQLLSTHGSNYASNRRHARQDSVRIGSSVDGPAWQPSQIIDLDCFGASSDPTANPFSILSYDRLPTNNASATLLSKQHSRKARRLRELKRRRASRRNKLQECTFMESQAIDNDCVRQEATIRPLPPRISTSRGADRDTSSNTSPVPFPQSGMRKSCAIGHPDNTTRPAQTWFNGSSSFWNRYESAMQTYDLPPSMFFRLPSSQSGRSMFPGTMQSYIPSTVPDIRYVSTRQTLDAMLFRRQSRFFPRKLSTAMNPAESFNQEQHNLVLSGSDSAAKSDTLSLPITPRNILAKTAQLPCSDRFRFVGVEHSDAIQELDSTEIQICRVNPSARSDYNQGTAAGAMQEAWSVQAMAPTMVSNAAPTMAPTTPPIMAPTMAPTTFTTLMLSTEMVDCLNELLVDHNIFGELPPDYQVALETPLPPSPTLQLVSGDDRMFPHGPSSSMVVESDARENKETNLCLSAIDTPSSLNASTLVLPAPLQPPASEEDKMQESFNSYPWLFQFEAGFSASTIVTHDEAEVLHASKRDLEDQDYTMMDDWEDLFPQGSELEATDAKQHAPNLEQQIPSDEDTEWQWYEPSDVESWDGAVLV